MSLAHWFVPSVSQQQIATWAVDVARHCHEEVAARLNPAVRQMSLAEARGYIQSRANRVLDAKLQTLRHAAEGDLAVISAVRRQAMDEVVRLAIGDLLRLTHQQPLPRRLAA